MEWTENNLQLQKVHDKNLFIEYEDVTRFRL